MNKHEQLVDVAKVTPTISIVGVSIMGIPLSDWAALLACVYSILMIGDWCWKKWNRRLRKTRREGDE